MFDIYWQALTTILMPQNLIAMILGSLWGLLAGALPGISTSMGVVLILSFTYTLSPMTAFVLLIGAYLGGITGGSITSILFGIPGEPSSVPTVIEGHALAKQGKAAYAMWVYLLCSIFGGLFSVVVMIVATPLIANFALRFGPAEYFALTVLGLSVVSGLSGGSMLKGFLSCFFGLFLATVGTDGITGQERFTFGTVTLLGGINFVVAMVGLLAVSEILIEAEEPFKEYKGGVEYRGLLRELPPFSLFRKYWLTMIRSPIIGTIVGALPGAGATIASFLAYGEAARTAKHEPEKFGNFSLFFRGLATLIRTYEFTQRTDTAVDVPKGCDQRFGVVEHSLHYIFQPFRRTRHGGDRGRCSSRCSDSGGRCCTRDRH